MTNKYDLISKLTYKAYVLSNAASEIGKLQDEISEATAELPDALDKEVDAIENSDTILQVETATHNARKILEYLGEGDKPADQAGDLILLAGCRKSLFYDIAGDLRSLQRKTAELTDRLPDGLEDAVGRIEEADDIADLQENICQARDILRGRA